MGKKKTAEPIEVVPVSTTEDDDDKKKGEEEDDDDEEEIELLQVEVGDMIKLKQVLDETASSAILEQPLVKEDFKLDNLKLFVMTLACGFAVVAQFAPLPFPDSRYILGACCCIYFILSGVLQFIVTFVDMDCILITKPIVDTDEEDTKKKSSSSTSDKNKSKTSQPKINDNMRMYGIRLRSDLPRFSEFYHITLEYQGMKNSPCVSQKWSVGQFFDVEGYFDEEGLVLEIDKLYAKFGLEQYDVPEDKKKATTDEKKKQ